MNVETKVYEGNQTALYPSVFRKKHNIKPNDIVKWREDEKGNIQVIFQKKVTIENVI
ncbi:MAG: hypothetical protein LBB45_01335 [Methanobrevibacter sp.]|jgi:bifunctional DNA-binding transcriptional regulator/antitoxin component of YhaV-PrlF toxin-antitoxin module|nr:hypothetical protein [Candidatus Methanovirga basalitermitum]